jgi:hypothetical protein
MENLASSPELRLIESGLLTQSEPAFQREIALPGVGDADRVAEPDGELDRRRGKSETDMLDGNVSPATIERV